jgi:hypothetical protein
MPLRNPRMLLTSRDRDEFDPVLKPNVSASTVRPVAIRTRG